MRLPGLMYQELSAALASARNFARSCLVSTTPNLFIMSSPINTVYGSTILPNTMGYNIHYFVIKHKHLWFLLGNFLPDNTEGAGTRKTAKWHLSQFSFRAPTPQRQDKRMDLSNPLSIPLRGTDTCRSSGNPCCVPRSSRYPWNHSDSGNPSRDQEGRLPPILIALVLLQTVTSHTENHIQSPA